jgi:hypothetical protein
MTKVLIDRYGIEYRRKIAESVCEIIEVRHISGVTAQGCPAPPLDQLHLMPPPALEKIDLTTYKGRRQNVIQITTSDIFGIGNLRVRIQAENMTLLESGSAVESFVGSGHWNYLTGVSVPSGTSVIVYAAATDCLGGVGARSERIKIP